MMMIKTEYLDMAESRATALLSSIDASRQTAISAGTAPEDAGRIGAVAEAVALDSISLAHELRSSCGGVTAISLCIPHIRALAEIVDAHTEGREPPEPAASAAAPPPEGLTAGQIAQMDRAVRIVTPTGAPEDKTPLPSPTQVATGKRRSTEASVDLGDWQPVAADIAALPWEESWVRGQLEAFRAEHKGAAGKRPRVTLAAWLTKRDGAEANAKKNL